LAIDIKHLYDKRVEEVKERKQMGVPHLASITYDEISKAGVT